MADRIVRFILAGDSRSAVKAMKDTETSADRTGRALDKTGGHATRSFAAIETGAHKMRKTVGLVAGVAGFGSIAYGIKDIVKAGQEWQQQQAQLQNALRNTHLPAAKNMERLNRATEEASTHGGFTPQEQTQGLAQLIRQTGSATKAIRLNKEATDLARGTGMSYATAIRSVSQLQTGQTGRLQRYIGTLIPSTRYTSALSAQERRNNPALYERARLLDRATTAQEANRRVLERFGGATKAYSATTAGSLGNAQHAFDLVSEELGKEFLPYVTRAAQWVTRMTSQFLRDWPRIRTEIRPVTDEIKTLVTDATNFVRAHPGILKVAAGLVAVGLAVEAISFAGKITGVKKLLGLVRKLTRAFWGESDAEAAAAAGGVGKVPKGVKPIVKETVPKGFGAVRTGAVAGAAALGISGFAAASHAKDDPLDKLNAFAHGADPTNLAHLVGLPSLSDLLPGYKRTGKLTPQSLQTAITGVSPAMIKARKRFDAGGGIKQNSGLHHTPTAVPGGNWKPTTHAMSDWVTHVMRQAVGDGTRRLAGHGIAPMPHIEIHPAKTEIKVNDRVLAEAVTHFTLRRGARR